MKTVEDFRAFVEAHRDDIEAIRVLYSKPYRAGLRYRQVKDLAAKLTPFNVDGRRPESVDRLWTAHPDFDEVPFRQMGGLGKVHQLVGERLPKLLEEMNERLAA